MQSNNSKKTFRPETEEKGRKRNSQKKQAAAAGVAMTAIAVILLGAGIGYSVQRAGKTESISLEEMQNSVSSALKGEMESAATSLEQLNQNIADNQKKLDEVNAQLAQREESLLQVETIQHRLEENASGMTGKVTDLEKTTHTKVNEIRTDMESIHTDVTKTLEEISRIMQEMDAQKKQDNTDHKESITEINRINESVQSVNQTVSRLEDRLLFGHVKYNGLYGLRECVQRKTCVFGMLRLHADSVAQFKPAVFHVSHFSSCNRMLHFRTCPLSVRGVHRTWHTCSCCLP